MAAGDGDGYGSPLSKKTPLFPREPFRERSQYVQVGKLLGVSDAGKPGQKPLLGRRKK